MKPASSNKPSLFLIGMAFATIYIVWGSTYFFIQQAIHGFPPMMMGAFRFLTAGGLLLGWCIIKGDRIWIRKDIRSSAISGMLMLFTATGGVIWAEQSVPSAIVAIMVSANPIWFVTLDKANRSANLKNKTTVIGLIVGFAGVLLLFGQALAVSLAGTFHPAQIIGFGLLLVDPIAWSAGALYSKKHAGDAPARVSSAWQMIIAGSAFVIAALAHREFTGFHIGKVPLQAWMSLGYLIIFGSICSFSAYIWLLKVRPAVQVSTHSYVNPVVAVLLGVLFAHESVSRLQVVGLLVILFSVLLVNFTKYSINLPKFPLKKFRSHTAQGQFPCP